MLPELKMRAVKVEKTHCSVCGGGVLEKIWDLPKLPLTGLYVEKPCPDLYPAVDQALMRCRGCGHAQLLYVLDPEFLYGSTYSHRSSSSAVAREGNDFFARFLEELTPGRHFENAVEIGANDLYLLRKIEHKAHRLTGIDPIWLGRQMPDDSKIKVIGKFIEEVNFSKELEGAPDLVLSSHTLEHLGDPGSPLKKLMEVSAPGALFVVEVPGFDSLVNARRFDQVFHQHIQYFSLASFQRLIEAVGGEYRAHRFNYDYWDGTMLVAFVKPAASPSLAPLLTERSSGGRLVEPEARGGEKADSENAPPAERVEEALRFFRKRMDILMQLLGDQEGPVYGYGAAQMLPVLAYHMKSDLGFLECVMDDNPARNGLAYPDLAVRIRLPDARLKLEGAAVLVTALDSVRPILRRLSQMPVKTVINPLQIF